MRGSQVRFLPGSPYRIGPSATKHPSQRLSESGRAPTVTSPQAPSHRRVVGVLAVSFALGMAVGLAVYLLWVSRGASLSTAVLVVCPPFILSYAIAANPDSAFAVVLGLATIIFANGCLYAGVAAGIYAAATLLATRGKKN